MQQTKIFDLHGIIYLPSPQLILDKNLKKELKTIQQAIKQEEKTKLNQIKPLPNAIKKLTQTLSNGDQIVIISTSLTQTQKLIINTLLPNNSQTQNIHFYNSSNYGPKSDPETWYQILKKYENITELYEDTQKYLEAAEYTVKKLGHNCTCKNKI